MKFARFSIHAEMTQEIFRACNASFLRKINGRSQEYLSSVDDTLNPIHIFITWDALPEAVKHDNISSTI